jgi:ferric-dicitrate binding protein FerR (iron transport regulator)
MAVNDLHRKNQVSKELLHNYFAGQATALQKEVIDEWVKNEDNKEVFFDYLAMWESTNPQFTVDSNEALQRHWQRMEQRTQASTAEPEALNEPVTGWLTSVRFRWMIAASVGIILLLSGTVFRNNLLFTTYRTAFGENSTVTLSDGSRVTLNANSSLRVPRFGFGTNNREVVLVGEADFSIKHLPDHRYFVVHTDKNFEVVVLGTEFLVNTREKGTKVVLNKGKVRLLYQEGKTSKQLTMKPGNLVTFDKDGCVDLKQTAKPQDFVSWKEHRFVFDETTLAEIGSLFAENYGIKLQIPDKALTQWTISGAFTAYSAEELIETIASASNLTYRQQGNTIVITQVH